MERMSPADAQMYWMSEKIPNDQFLVYVFDGAPQSLDAAIDLVIGRAELIPDLRLRIADVDCALDYPYWVRTDAEWDQVVVHDLADPTWDNCLDGIAALADTQLDPRDKAWRLHVFTGVTNVPRCASVATVAVLQICHALADGRRSSALARLLFGPTPPEAAEPGRSEQPYSVAQATAVAALRLPKQIGSLGWHGLNAARTHRRLVDDMIKGLVPQQAKGRPLLLTNTRPEGARAVRTLVRRRDDFPGPTVTVSALTAVSLGLSDYLRECGEDPTTLGAEVTMAKSGAARSRNHFRNVGISLYADTADLGSRSRHIADALGQRQLRNNHPALRAGDEAFAAVPAPLLRWGILQFDPNRVPDTVTGNTVVSSVNRGAADLRFANAPVLFTTGFPALSPVMGLTHAVHGIGDTVAISVHAAESAVGDIDNYMEILGASISWNQIVSSSR
ncbi:wax ester synthase-like acyl-CoA acyltransferase family protein [Williamsia limnetica]|uniref:Wax ester synthase-like acyl-CoA acyltransferase family protein n=1 Tax=Williamsia limnetica TaxID=882452 RepID=A0A318RGY0_WILLI|nr:wax ester/triacylglycerol synthase domain-containing protein [Williamsia limnetica]PYE13731.1 wax ester synthase-like acyl-CoA acyltransferase family protein [Williamsia limnetica]